MNTETRVVTESGSLYLKKLCRHFAHKVPATMAGDRGIVEFPFGRCRLEATADALTMVIMLTDGQQVAKAEQVLAEHLQRMARKEALDIHWVRTP